MVAFNSTDREKIANADIVDFLESKGYKVERQGKYHVLADHRSFVIYDRKSFYYWSKNYGGNLYQLVHNFMEYDTAETNKILGEYIGSSSYKEHEKSYVNTNSKGQRTGYYGSVELPQKNVTNKHIYAYLNKSRKIPLNIINSYVKKGLLYEDIRDNCVFVGVFKDHPYYAMKRSTHGKTYKGDVAGSYKAVGIMTPGNENRANLVITEAVIDQMSFKALMDPDEKESYLSINGVGSLENTLGFWLARYPEKWNTVYFALDNDEAGKNAIEKGIKWLNENYPNIDHKIFTPLGKDWNEDLCTDELRAKYPLYKGENTSKQDQGFCKEKMTNEYKQKSIETGEKKVLADSSHTI